MNKNYLIIGLIILALVVIGVIAARQPETPIIDPEINGDAEVEEVASLSVSDQVVTEESIIVDSVYALENGWVVLHRTSEEGDLIPDSVVGIAAVSAGSSEGLVIELTESVEDGEVLAAMLHVDTGVVGEYEFSEETVELDGPVLANGDIVLSFFTVSIPAEEEEAEVEAEVEVDTEEEVVE